GFCADIEGSAVGGFHDPWATTGHDYQFGSRPVVIAAAAYQPSELARDLVVAALCQNPLGHRELAHQDGIAGIYFEGLAQCLCPSSRRRGFRNSRAAIHHDGIANGMLLQESLRLEVLDLEAHASRLVAF